MEQENKKNSSGEILIIEDTLASLQLLADLLGDAGYAVRTAQDGEMGLMSVQARAPDLILLDIRMPGMDGFEVCRRLKVDPNTASVPVIFLTALQDAQDKMQGFQLGAVDYIIKPYQAEEVLARVRTHVELHQLQTRLKNKVLFRTMKLEQEIAERKQVEAALQESEILFRTLARVSPVGIFHTDVRGLGFYVNERWCEIAGISQEQAKGTGWAQAVHPDDREWVVAKWYEAAANSLLFKEEFRFQRPDGSIVWVLAQAAAEISASGEIAGYVGAITDITGRKRIEDLLRASEYLLSNAARIAHLGTWEWNILDGSNAWSEEQFRIFGVPNTTQPSYSVFMNALHPEDRDKVVKALELALTGERPYEVECRAVWPNGELRHVLCQGEVYRDGKGKPLRMIGTVLDITERKRIEEALHAGEERYRKIFTDSAVVMLVIDPAGGRIVDANAAACAYYGYAPAQLKAMKILDINTLSPEQVRTEMRRVEEQKKAHFDFCHRLANGELRNVEVSSGPIEIDGRTLLLSIITDVTERKSAEQEREQLLLKVSRNAAETEAILASQNDAILLYDTEMNVRRANPSFPKVYGFDPVGLNLRDIVQRVSCQHLDGRPFVLDEQPTPRALRGEEIRRTLFSVVRADGVTAIVETSSRPMYVEGSVMGTVTVWHDITESKRAEEALRLQSEITANSAEGIALIKTSDGTIHYANRQFETLFGYAPGELAGRHVSIINAPTEKSPQEAVSDIMRALEKQDIWSGEVLNRKKDGSTLWTSANVSTFQHPELGTLLITYQTDISEKKKTEEMIWKQANFDALTSLPNRHMFHDRLVQEIRKANRASQKLALMFIDLDRFKEVNDTLGHDMGDALLIKAAHRIVDCVRATDMVARMGGDEFTVTLADIVDISSIERVAQNILQKLSEPFHLGTEIAYVSASIGITLYPDDATGMEELLKNADQTMYVAKGLGRNRHSYFTHKLQEAAQARLRLINDLRGALAANQFRVYFQPIVDMATGHIHKAEALIRWQHPERGLVSPAEFIPLAEETGLIFEIGDWVFRESARWVKRWRELHHAEFQVSVNKSPVQFYKLGDKDSAWLAHLRDLGLPGQSIVIEITEGLLLGVEQAIGDALFILRDAGIQIAIDDFGTGYSSLSYLNRFHIDYLKIDQSFTRNLTPESSDMALSEAIIVMAHKLGLKVIAEGVETEAQCDLLAAAGCDYAQGYLYSRPLPPEEFEKLLLHK